MNITVNNLVEGINAKAHRKQNSFYKSYQLVSFDPDKKDTYFKGFNTCLDVRFYGSGSTIYCCIWGSLNGVYYNGSGKAGGYGYDKERTAFEAALNCAGFEVSGLAATGENEVAINEIAKLQGLEYFTIIRSHA